LLTPTANFIHSEKKQFNCEALRRRQDNHALRIQHQLLKAMIMKLKVMSIFVGAFCMAGAHADMRAGQFMGEVELATPVAESKETVIKGITWKCTANTCSAHAENWPGLDSFMKQCRIVAADLGPLTKFRARGRAASSSELKTCNRNAARSAG
jgi:hypothetical protein